MVEKQFNCKIEILDDGQIRITVGDGGVLVECFNITIDWLRQWDGTHRDQVRNLAAYFVTRKLRGFIIDQLKKIEREELQLN